MCRRQIGFASDRDRVFFSSICSPSDFVKVPATTRALFGIMALSCAWNL